MQKPTASMTPASAPESRKNNPISFPLWRSRAKAARAMAVLAREILGVAEPLSDADFLAIRRRLPSAVGREREELEALLRLGSKRQQDLAEDDNLPLQQ